MEKVTKTKKAFAVVTKDTRELVGFGSGMLDSYSVHYTEDDAKLAALENKNTVIVLPCTISYETLKECSDYAQSGLALNAGKERGSLKHVKGKSPPGPLHIINGEKPAPGCPVWQWMEFK